MLRLKKSSSDNLLPKDLLNGLVKASDPTERVLMQEDRRRWDSGKPSANGGGHGDYGNDEWMSHSISPSVTISPSEEAI